MTKEERDLVRRETIDEVKALIERAAKAWDDQARDPRSRDHEKAETLRRFAEVYLD